MIDETLVRIATVGTIHPTLRPVMIDWHPSITPSLPLEGKILLSSAIADLQVRAGWTPAYEQTTNPTVTSLSRQPNATVARLFSQLLVSSVYADLLPEVLTMLAAHSFHAPPETLPYLLNFGYERNLMRSPIKQVLGERGEWLAEFREIWSWCFTRPIDQAWSRLGEAERSAAFARYRAEDPRGAREFLSLIWQLEPRRWPQALWYLRFNLSLEDEPFLEQLLEDETARLVAARLLACLPESAYVQRLLKRLKPHLRFHPAGTYPIHFSFLYPLEFTPEMARDGILYEHDVNVFPRREVWWLHQMLRLVRPSYWYHHYHLTPEKLVRAAHYSEVGAKMVDALVWSCFLENDTELVQVLLRTPDDVSITQQVGLFSLLSADEREALLIHLLNEYWDGLSRQSILSKLLRSHNRAWSHSFTERILAPLELRVDQLGGLTEDMIELVDQLALYGPPDLGERILALFTLPMLKLRQWRAKHDHLEHLLQFRCEFHKALAP
ncbi:MAG: DUF5691 domain-containing protein [Anaerolineae bacterium]|jgi:hypothetical protein|nr:DUF5691 domain-containing protein [Anaerolineae bacterium]